MEEKRPIQSDSWIEYADTFISGNRGRISTLKIEPEGENKQIIAKEIPPVSLVVSGLGYTRLPLPCIVPASGPPVQN